MAMAQDLWLQVPVYFEDVRAMFKRIVRDLPASATPVISREDALHEMKFLIDAEVREETLLALETVGVILGVEWDSFNEEDGLLRRESHIVLDPTWLAQVLSTVVTIRHSFVKHGVLLKGIILISRHIYVPFFKKSKVSLSRSGTNIFVWTNSFLFLS